MLLIICIVLLLLFLGGGYYGHRSTSFGPISWSPAAILVAVLIILVLTGYIRFN
jgi:hypothetical protein